MSKGTRHGENLRGTPVSAREQTAQWTCKARVKQASGTGRLQPSRQKEKAPRQPTKANRDANPIQGSPHYSTGRPPYQGGYTMSSIELLSLVEQYKEAQQLIEAAQAEMDTIKATISAEMARRDVERIDVGTHKVTLKVVTTSRLDGKAIKAAAPELAARFTKTTTTTRFCVA